MKRSKISILAEDHYNALYSVYAEMIGTDLEKLDEDNWLTAETKLNECLEFLEKIWSKDKDKE